MAWIAVDENECEYVYNEKQIRGEYEWNAPDRCTRISDYATLIITGRKMTWKDEPVEVGVMK